MTLRECVINEKLTASECVASQHLYWLKCVSSQHLYWLKCVSSQWLKGCVETVAATLQEEDGAARGHKITYIHRYVGARGHKITYIHRYVGARGKKITYIHRYVGNTTGVRNSTGVSQKEEAAELECI